MSDVATPAGWYPSPTDPVPSPADEGTPFWKRKIMWPVYGLIGLVIVGAAVGGGEAEQVAESDVPTAGPDLVAEPATELALESEAAPADAADTEPAPAIATRDNPLPQGQSIEVTAETFGDADNSVWSLTVTEPVRDVTSEATTEGLAADPLEGHIIVGTPFKLTLIDADKEPLAPLFNVEIDYFSPDMLGIAETLLACGLWNEAFNANTEVFIGGTISGLLCAEVPATDLDGGLLITADEEGERVFLSTE
jgi:hypothetical protein